MANAHKELVTGTEHEGMCHSDILDSEASVEPRKDAISTSSRRSGAPTKPKQTRNQRRARKRVLLEASGGIRKPMKAIVIKRVSGVADTNSTSLTDFASAEIRVAKGGWLGSRKPVEDEDGDDMNLDDLLRRGYRLLEWDGVNPHAILDDAGNVVAMLAGRARGSFEEVLQEVTSLFDKHSQTLPPPKATTTEGDSNTRGIFHTAITGISYGGGQTEPMNSAAVRMYQNAVKELTESVFMKRLAGFQNKTFQSFFPKIHTYYAKTLSTLYTERPLLRRPYKSSIMPAAAFNLGPVTVCRPHRDSANLSFGICSITALGHFDHQCGGHLVLRELRTVVMFPAGSTVHIPSACLTHSNTRIRAAERRYSFTQYAAGSLFSYIENGMKSKVRLMRGLNTEDSEKFKCSEASGERWQNGRALFPHISEYTHN